MPDYIKKTFDLPADVVDQLIVGSDLAHISKRAFLIQAINNEFARVDTDGDYHDIAVPDVPEATESVRGMRGGEFVGNKSGGWRKLGRRWYRTAS